MSTRALTLSLLLLVGCKVSVDRGQPPPRDPPPSTGKAYTVRAAEPAPVPEAYRDLPQREAFAARSDVTLDPGYYRGDFTLETRAIRVAGAGKDRTVIEGDLILEGGQGTVADLTVLGDVVFASDENALEGVDHRGAIQDEGARNRYR